MRTLKNIRITFRNLAKNKWVTFLNVLGLTVGLTVSALVFIFVINQRSIDHFIPNIDRIYCLLNNGDTYFSQNEINLVKDQLLDVDKITYCTEDWSPQVFLKVGNQSFKTEKMLTADSCFFRVFDFESVYGNTSQALNTSNKVVLTRSFAQKLFGDVNPVGQNVVYNSTYLQGELLEVSAVIEDLPSTSSWDFDAVLSFQTNYKIDWYVDNMQAWGTRNYKPFIKLNDRLSEEQLLTKLKSLDLKSVPEWEKEQFDLSLFPYSDVYFDLSQMTLTKHGNRVTVLIIGVIGVLILMLACINYINMATAQRKKRYKNISIVKILGGGRKEIIQMMTMESFIQVLLSGLVSLMIIDWALPVLNNLISVNTNVSEILDVKKVGMIAFVLALMIAVTGIIPGFIFSRKNPFNIIKNQVQCLSRNSSRNGLLLVQFAVTVVLIISILLIHKQNSLLQNKDIGIEKEYIVYAYTNDALWETSESFNDEIRRIPGISEFTYSESVLIDNGENWGRDIENNGERKTIHFSKLSVAPNFFKFFGIKLREGRWFNENSEMKEEFIFNSTAKQEFDMDELRNAKMATSEPDNGRIVGIVEDYNFESLHVPVRAAGFMCSGDFDEVIYLKLNAANKVDIDNTMNKFQAVWNQLSPDFPLEYYYLDNKLEEKYSEEKQFQKIISYTTLISILLSCLGLIGLTFYVTEQRTKEIGIRKVNGAKISEVLVMLNKDFIKLMAVAFLIATPIAYFVMNKWLENFAYKTDLSWWIFALAGVLALGIALLTISFQSWKAATRNPVEALRYE